MNEYEPNPMLENIVKKPKKPNKWVLILGGVVFVLLIVILFLALRKPEVITTEVERRQSLNEIALELEYFISENKLDALDSAITRSGRFGKHIEVKAPDTVEGINKILDIHTKNKKLSPDVDKVMLSKRLLDKQTTGADIAFIVNNAHENAFERAGIYTKMENGTFEKSDIDNLKITNEDFAKAIKDFVHKNDAANRRPIGFNKR